MISTPYGSIKTRGGTENVDNVGATGVKAKLKEFTFNLNQKYLLVILDETIQVYQNDILIDTITTTGLTDTLFSTLKTAQAEDTMVFTHPDLKTKQIQRNKFYTSTWTTGGGWTYSNGIVTGSVANTFNKNTFPFNFKQIPITITYTIDTITAGNVRARLDSTDMSGALHLFTIRTTAGTYSETFTIDAATYNTIGFSGVNFSGTISNVYIVLGATTYYLTDQYNEFGIYWTYSDYSWVNVPKDDFGNQVTTSIAQTLTPSATEGAVKLTLGGSTWATIGGTAGQYVDGGGGRVRITEIDPTTATVAYGYTIIPFYTTALIASSAWSLITGYEDVWSVTRGYPTTCMFYQQRLWFGGSKSKPNTIWASRVGQYTDFDNIGNYDNDGINQTISSTQIDEIVNIYANRGIQVLTAGAEWVVPEGATTPNTFTVNKTTSNGSLSTIDPLDITGTTLFFEKNGKSLLGFVYTDTQASYMTSSLSLLTDLINAPVAMAIDSNSSQNVGNFIYIVMTDGSMAVFCIVLDQKIQSPVKFTGAGSGLIKDVVNVAGDTYILVDRGTSGVLLEKLTTGRTDIEETAIAYSTINYSKTFGTGYQSMSVPYQSILASNLAAAMNAQAPIVVTEVIYIDTAGATQTHTVGGGGDFTTTYGKSVIVKFTTGGTFAITQTVKSYHTYTFANGKNMFGKLTGDLTLTASQFGALLNAKTTFATEIWRYISGEWQVYNFATGLGTNFTIDGVYGYIIITNAIGTWSPSDATGKLTGLSAEYEGKTIAVYDDTVSNGQSLVTSGATTETLANISSEPVDYGLPFLFSMTSNKIAINGQTENIEKRIAKATVVTNNTPKLTFCGQTKEKDDDLYDFYSVTGFARDTYFTVTGTSIDSAEILSVLLNINYGEK